MIREEQWAMRHADKDRDAQFCPICGVRDPSILRGGHRCNESTLRGIDGALRRDPDDEEPRRIPEGRRIAEGFWILEQSDDDW